MPNSSADKKSAYNNKFRELLQAEFSKRLKKNPAYSMRAFAKFLEVDQSLLSKVMRAQRSLSPRCWESIGKKLEMNEAEIHTLLFNPKNEEALRVVKTSLGGHIVPKTDWVLSIEKSRLTEFRTKMHQLLLELGGFFQAKEETTESVEFTVSLFPSINE